MKKLLFIAVTLFLAFLASTPALAQNFDFNGKWKLEASKSTLPEYTPVLTRIKVRINGDSLITERYYDTGDGQEYPFNENVTLDGKEYNITIYDMPRKTKALPLNEDGSLYMESTTSTSNDDFVSKETWKTENGNKTLIISFKNMMGGNEGAGVFVLNKIE